MLEVSERFILNDSENDVEVDECLVNSFLNIKRSFHSVFVAFMEIAVNRVRKFEISLMFD